MKMPQKKDENKLPNELLRVLNSLPLFKGVDLRRVQHTTITGGQHNHLYRVQIDDLDVAVRIAMKPEKRTGYYSEELKNQKAVAKIGIAPKFLHFNVSNGTMVYPFQKGDTLKTKHLEDKELTQTLFEIIRQVHDLNVTFAYDYDPLKSLRKRIKNTLGKRNGLETKRINRFMPDIESCLELLEKTPQPKCPCHGDLILENFILTDKGPILIDWQISGMGDPQEDLATFLWATNEPVKALKKLMSYYFKEPNPVLEARTIMHLVLVSFYWVLRYEKYLTKGQQIAKNEGKQTKRLNEISEILDSPLYWHSKDVLTKKIKETEKLEKNEKS